LFARVSSGTTKGAGGLIVPIRGDDVPYGGQGTGDFMFRFMRSKFSPIVGTAWDIAEGKNVVGEPVTPTKAAFDSLTPLAIREVYEALEDKGIVGGTAMGLLAIFGMGLNIYETSDEPSAARVNASVLANPGMVRHLDQYPEGVQDAVTKALGSRARLVILSDGIPSSPAKGKTYDETLVDWAEKREKWVRWFEANKDAPAVQRALREVRRSDQFRNIVSQSGVYARPSHGKDLKKWRVRLANTRAIR
jgi:hypothetical protein